MHLPDVSRSFMIDSKRLHSVVAVIAGLLLATWCMPGTSQAQAGLPMLCLDAHEDVLEKLEGRGDELDGFLSQAQATIPNWRAGGINAVWFAAWLDPR